MAGRKSLALGMSMLLHLGLLYGLGAAILVPARDNRLIQVDLETWAPPAPAANAAFSKPRPAPAKPVVPAQPGLPAVHRSLPPPAVAGPVPQAVVRAQLPTSLAPPAPRQVPPPLTAEPGIRSRLRPAEETASRLQTYYAAVLARIEAAKQYPPSAQRRQIQGDVVVTFQLSPGGRLIDVSLAGSSGFKNLDAAALEAVRQAAPYPRFPADTGARPKALTVTLSFVLMSSN